MRLDPRLTAAYNGRGAVRLELGQFDIAILDLNKAIETDSKYAVAYLNRGIALWLKRRSIEADKDFRSCLELNPQLRPLLESRKKEISHKFLDQ